MKRLLTLVLPVLIVLGCAGEESGSSKTFDRDQAIAACEKMISDFQSTLKKELMTAMAEGGPENAITVCNAKAPLVADSFSQMAGFNIRRVSLKQRQAGFSPDSFEVATLEKFLAGEESAPQVYSEVTFDSADVRHFRYMKEIKTGELCLKCHGNPDTFSEGLMAILAEHYPDDPAVGYNAGESRGAFSITVIFPEAEATVKNMLGKENY